jgi:hypothetical protein
MPSKIGLIPRELLEPARYFSGMTAQDSRALLHSCEWHALTSRTAKSFAFANLKKPTLRPD